jgi:hypothetical protein
LAAPIDGPLAEVLDVVEALVDAGALAAGALVCELELLLLPHAATTSATAIRAAAELARYLIIVVLLGLR